MTKNISLPQKSGDVAVQNKNGRVCVGIWILCQMDDPYTTSPRHDNCDSAMDDTFVMDRLS